MPNSEGASSEVAVTDDVITNIRAVEIIELGVEASISLSLKIGDWEGGISDGAASEVAMTEVAHAGNCGGDGRPD